MPFRMVVTDLDGTFMCDFHTPHPDNVRAAQACRAQGVTVCACTGRMWTESRGALSRAQITGLCAINNGATIIDIQTGQVRRSVRFDPKAVPRLLERAICDFDAQFLVAGTYETHMLRTHAFPYHLKKRKELQKADPAWARCIHVYDTFDELVSGCAQDAQQINLGVCLYDLCNLRRVQDTLSAIADVEITASGPGTMEITPQHVNKGTGVAAMARMMDVPYQEVIAFGDSYNDAQMLLWAGTGVAMGNADERLKQVADQVAEPNTRGGVAKVLNTLVLHSSRRQA